MATSGDWSEEEDHATFVRISELEKQLKEERERLSSKCMNPSKPRKTASKPPLLQPLQEQRTQERAHELLESTNFMPKLVYPLQQGISDENSKVEDVQRKQPSHLSSTSAKEKDKDSRTSDERKKRKEAKKAAAKAELEKLRLENQRIEDQEAEANDILAKLSLEVRNEEKRRVQPKANNVKQKPQPTKHMPVEDSTEAVLLKREIEKQKQEGRAIASQRKNITQILHQIRKAQNVQICFVGNINESSSKHLLQLLHTNSASLEIHLKPMFPKLQISSAFVMQNGKLQPEVCSFTQDKSILSWKTFGYGYGSIDLVMLLQVACSLEWDEGSTKVLALILKNHFIYCLPSHLLETLRTGHKVTQFSIFCETLVDQARVSSWRRQAGSEDTWVTVQKTSNENIVQALARSIRASIFRQEVMLYSRKVLGDSPAVVTGIPTELRGTLSHVQPNVQSSRLQEAIDDRGCYVEELATIHLESRPVSQHDRWTVYKGYFPEGRKKILIRSSNSIRCDYKMLANLIDAMNVAYIMGQSFISDGMRLEFHAWNLFSSAPYNFILQELADPFDFRYKSDKFHSDTIFNCTEAFSHWTHHVSNGFLLIDCFEVAKTNHGFYVTDVSVHSKDLLRFSTFNMGTPGMDQFFMWHECNDHCRRLKLPRHPKQAVLSPLEVVIPSPEQKSLLSSIGSFLGLVSSGKPTGENMNATEPSCNINTSGKSSLPGKYPDASSVKESFNEMHKPNIHQNHVQSARKTAGSAPWSNKPVRDSNDQSPKDYAAAVKSSQADQLSPNQPKKEDSGARSSRRDHVEQAKTSKGRSGSLETKKSNSTSNVRARSASPMVRKKKCVTGSESKQQSPKMKEPLIPVKVKDVKLRTTTKKK